MKGGAITKIIKKSKGDIIAKKVKNQSDKYKRQLSKCGKYLTTRKYIIF